MTGFDPRTRWLVLLVFGCLAAGCTSCGSGSSPAPLPPPVPPERPAFDEAHAFADLEQQVAFGPRNPGSQGHQDCLAWLVHQLRPLADLVVQQDFQAATPMGGPYGFTNVIALFGQDQPGEVWLLGAHWDTRPVADEDPDPANRGTAILGANDGASGVAVLLEIARALGEVPPPCPVLLAFFDAEDSGISGSGMPYMGFCIGSAYLADDWPTELPRPEKVVVVDLVGQDEEHNLRVGTPNGSNDRFDLPYERYGQTAAPGLANEVWTAAEVLGHDAFKRRAGPYVIDDHKPFLDAGYDAIDIIDFPPPEWHTVDDTPEHCSPDSLLQVGDTLLEVIYAG